MIDNAKWGKSRLNSNEIYFELAGTFLEKSIIVFNQIDLKGQSEHTIAELIFVCTNLTFSVELYLKGLVMISGGKKPRSHNIWQIFQRLPDAQQSALASQFMLGLKNVEMKRPLTSVSVQISWDTMFVDQPEKSIPRGESRLIELLKRTSENYVSHRYLFLKNAGSASSRNLRFDVEELIGIAVIMRDICTNIINHKKTE